VRWVIDPLDGTANYVRGFPSYGVSIGVEVGGEPVIGVVVDARGARTEGIRGVGATQDGRPIRPSSREDLALAVVATGFGYDPRAREQQADVAAVVLRGVADIRRSGSAAFDLVAAAAGEVDAYYEVGLFPWDLSGGRAIVEAAGGIVRTIPQPEGKDLAIATPAQLLEPILELLARAGLATS